MEHMVLVGLGAIIGSVISTFIFYLRTSTCVLKIDRSNPEKDVYRFEIDELDTLLKKKHVLMKIKHDADLSQQ